MSESVHFIYHIYDFMEAWQQSWMLSIDLDGRAEECGFASYAEALTTLEALCGDYQSRLRYAVLRPRERAGAFRRVTEIRPAKVFVN